MTTPIDFAALQAFLFERALPFWSTDGMDRAHGGPVERLAVDGGATDPGFKRVRVIARQTYAFSHAHLLGHPGALEAARACRDLLVGGAWLGPDAGWARRLTSAGAVLDATQDLYDIAFALFGLGWWRRAAGEAAAGDEAIALATLDHLEARMRHPAGGFLHELPAKGHRQQNPHMHLLEALLVWVEASDHPRFAAMAHEVIDLFVGRFFDAGTGTLAEYFDEDLNRAAGPDGRITEPGHQFEWAWILAQAQRLLDRDLSAVARRLIDVAEAHGVDPATSVTFNQVRDDGVVLDAGSRTWPNTERMKAAVAAFELFGDDPRPMLGGSVRVLFDRYLDRPAPGLWIDAFDAEGRQVSDHVPTSTLYHVFLAFAEALRIAPAVHARFG